MILEHANIIAQTSTHTLILSSAHNLPLGDKSVNCIATSPPY